MDIVRRWLVPGLLGLGLEVKCVVFLLDGIFTVLGCVGVSTADRDGGWFVAD